MPSQKSTSHTVAIARVRRLALASFFIGLLLVNSGCYHYRITAPKFDPATDYKCATRSAFFWGLAQPKDIKADNCVSNAIDEVVVDNNFGYSLITVVTLGIWSPMKVRWKCSKPCQKSGDL